MAADNGCAGFDRHIGQGCIRPDSCAGGDRCCPVQLHAGQQGCIVFKGNGYVDPGVVGIHDSYTITHMFFQDAFVEFTPKLRKLHAVVRTFNLPTILDSEGGGAVPLIAGYSEHIGNVFFALRVVGRDL